MDIGFHPGPIVWDTSTYLQYLHAESTVRSHFSMESQVDAIVRDRRGGMCHHYHPTGVSDTVGSDADWDLVEFFSHRCTFCAVRHLVVGDRPLYVQQRLHKKLFTRAQHVVASDRSKPKGQLANIMITHGTLSDHTNICPDSRYAIFIEHCVRAELKLLGGHFKVLKCPSLPPAGGGGPIFPPTGLLLFLPPSGKCPYPTHQGLW